jgi:polyferredoxin
MDQLTPQAGSVLHFWSQVLFRRRKRRRRKRRRRRWRTFVTVKYSYTGSFLVALPYLYVL